MVEKSKADAGKASGGQITVEQIGSPARGGAAIYATLTGLGLNRQRARRTLPDTPEVRGMIRRVQHLVRVIDGKA